MHFARFYPSVEGTSSRRRDNGDPGVSGRMKGWAGGGRLLIQERGRQEECSRCDNCSQSKRKKGHEKEAERAEEEVSEGGEEEETFEYSEIKVRDPAAGQSFYWISQYLQDIYDDCDDPLTFPLLLSSGLSNTLVSFLLLYLLSSPFPPHPFSPYIWTSPPPPLLQLSSFCEFWHPLSVLPLLFPSLSCILFFFSTYFSVRCCLQEAPCQWELLSVPGPDPVGPLWSINSCLGEGQQPPELAVLPPLSFDSARSCRAARFRPKHAGPEPAVVLLVEEVFVCVGCLVGWLSSVSQHNKNPLDGMDCLTVTATFLWFLCFDMMWGKIDFFFIMCSEMLINN